MQREPAPVPLPTAARHRRHRRHRRHGRPVPSIPQAGRRRAHPHGPSCDRRAAARAGGDEAMGQGLLEQRRAISTARRGAIAGAATATPTQLDEKGGPGLAS
jgi:hypothetical protein